MRQMSIQSVGSRMRAFLLCCYTRDCKAELDAKWVLYLEPVN